MTTNHVERLAQYLGSMSTTHVAMVGSGRYAITADRGEGPIPEWVGFESTEDAEIFVAYLQARQRNMPSRQQASYNRLRDALGYGNEPPPQDARFAVVSLEPCTSVEHITRVLGGIAL